DVSARLAGVPPSGGRIPADARGSTGRFCPHLLAVQLTAIFAVTPDFIGLAASHAARIAVAAIVTASRTIVPPWSADSRVGHVRTPVWRTSRCAGRNPHASWR